MNNIYLLTDYKNQFGSKWGAIPYRSGLCLDLIEKLFKQNNIYLKVLNISEAQSLKEINGCLFLYTSSEDNGYYYKSFIEDVILSLELSGGIVIPKFKFLRANNNKSFMELLRNQFDFNEVKTLTSYSFGTLEELKKLKSLLSYPIVLKKSSGAMSSGVYLAKDEKDLFSKVKKVSKTDSINRRLKDFLRKYKHEGYVPESIYRKKFVVQEFIPGLSSDYKILIFGNRYYIFERPTRKNDFRASGSGNKNYIFGSKVKCPPGIFDIAQKVFESLGVPHLSIDLAYDGKQFYLIEFQALYFGTVGVVQSDGFYMKEDNYWTFKNEYEKLEKVYTDSIIQYLNS